MKIAITGVTGFRNRGVEALVGPILSQLCLKYDTPEIVVYSGSPEYDRRRTPLPLKNCIPEGREAMVRGRIGRCLLRFGIESGKMEYPGWEDLATSDLLIVTGGDVFSSEYGDSSFNRHLIPMRVARNNQVPFVIFSQSIGPFTKNHHSDWFLEEARHAARISVREELTWNYLTQQLRLPADQISRGADPAFLLESAPVPFLGLSYQQCETGPLVAVSISQGISDWLGDERERRVSAWGNLCSRMIREWGVSILMIPHVQEPYSDDTLACTDVWRRMGFDPRVRICGEDLSAPEYKGIISGCEMVVAERMHAGIAGLSSQVCTTIIAYSNKARGIVSRLVGDELAQEGALIEGSDFADLELVWTKLERTWQRRAEICQTLSKTIPEEQKRAKMAFEILP
jgi:colanic acid/amylovoran biosynthesis protein